MESAYHHDSPPHALWLAMPASWRDWRRPLTRAQIWPLASAGSIHSLSQLLNRAFAHARQGGRSRVCLQHERDRSPERRNGHFAHPLLHVINASVLSMPLRPATTRQLSVKPISCSSGSVERCTVYIYNCGVPGDACTGTEKGPGGVKRVGLAARERNKRGRSGSRPPRAKSSWHSTHWSEHQHSSFASINPARRQSAAVE
jgi:hypothetical protein